MRRNAYLDLSDEVYGDGMQAKFNDHETLPELPSGRCHQMWRARCAGMVAASQRSIAAASSLAGVVYLLLGNVT
jgi:hypothetical protein